MTIDVFGPGDIVIKQDVSQVVLKPGQVLRYTVEVPAELGKPTGLRLTLDDPLIEDFQAVEAAIRNLYSTVSTKGEFNGFLRLYADIFGVELIRYTFRFPPGSHEFSFELYDELMSDPWELLVRLGGGALAGSNINIFGTIWNIFRGEQDLDEALDNLFPSTWADWASTWGWSWGSRQPPTSASARRTPTSRISRTACRRSRAGSTVWWPTRSISAHPACTRSRCTPSWRCSSGSACGWEAPSRPTA